MKSVEPLCCAHCGLPVNTRVRQAPGGPVYCCIGCAMVAAVAGAAKDGTGADVLQSRALLLRVGLAAFFSANVMMLSLFLYSLERPGAESAPAAVLTLIRALLLAFSAPVFAILAPPFLAGLLRDLRRRQFSMDSLIAIGAGAAFAWSCASVVSRSGAVYFDTAAMLLLLVTAGRLLEANARAKGRRAIRELMELQPPQARAWRDGAWKTGPAAAVLRGERVQVSAGGRIPVDGRIVTGAGAIDESSLTGEPLPAEKREGDAVHAGALCLDAVLEIACTADSSDSLLARMVTAVEEAQRRRSPLERTADRVAAAFVPFTLLLAGAVLLYWWPHSREKAWLSGLSVLVAACPCALGIALPVVNVLALAAAARSGILVRSAEALERLAGVNTVALDKTGTVTRGIVQVKRIVPVEGRDVQEVLAIAAAAASGSLHPVARAIERTARESGIACAARRSIQIFPGRGIEAELDDGERVLLGQPRWVASRISGPAPDGAVSPEVPLDPRAGVTWCAAGERLAGAVLVEDPVAPEAVKAAAACRAMGLRLVLLSGDRQEAVEQAASLLGIAEYAGGLLPEEKTARIEALRARGERVAMAGDGINDAPALAAADAGIAVSGGTDIAREIAEVVFLEGGLWKLPQVIALARRARRIGIQNLAWTFGYNSVALSLAACGLLRPVWAAAIMLLSSVLVIANSVRVQRPPRDP